MSISLRLSVSILSLNNINELQNHYSLPLIDGNNNDTTSVAPNVIDQKPLSSNLNTNCRKMIWRHRYQQKCRIHAKKHLRPILAKGWRMKYMTVQNEEAMKRKLRLKNHRNAVRKMKEKRHNLRYLLERQIYKLELEQKCLLLQVEYQHLYKQYLEIKFKKMRSINQQNSSQTKRE